MIWHTKLLLRTLAIVAILLSCNAFATKQMPDTMRFGPLEILIDTSWAFPSPLTLYFEQKQQKSPFEAMHTANYRGHVATWEIENGKLYLKEVAVGETVKNPDHFGVYSKQSNPSATGAVFADWFTGLVRGVGYYGDDYYSKPEAWFIFHFHKGVLLESAKVSSEDFGVIESAGNGAELPKHLDSAKELLTMYWDYTDFYYRLGYGEPLYADNFKGRVISQKGSPLLALYEYNLHEWPYNWKNRDLNGAPNCHWLIENGNLYLTQISLHTGSGIYEVESADLDLSDFFNTKPDQKKVLAKWYSGVLLVIHSDTPEKPMGNRYEDTLASLVQVIDGKITKVRNVEPSFDIYESKTFNDPEVEELVKQWRVQEQ